VSSVVLYVVESTFSRGFESYLRSHSFNGLGFRACCLRAVCKNQPGHLLQRQADPPVYHVAIDHGRPDVAMAHCLLLHSQLCSDLIQPTPIGVAEAMRAEPSAPSRAKQFA
jgi:hypothetical protein